GPSTPPACPRASSSSAAHPSCRRADDGPASQSRYHAAPERDRPTRCHQAEASRSERTISSKMTRLSSNRLASVDRVTWYAWPPTTTVCQMPCRGGSFGGAHVYSRIVLS